MAFRAHCSWPLRLGVLLALALWPVVVTLGGPTRFHLRTLPPTLPFTQVRTWTPVLSSTPAPDALLLLHGSQAATTPDPTWLAWLRTRRPFDQKILIVPSIPDAHQWNNDRSIGGLRTLLEQTALEQSLEARHTFLMGFSAGASRGFHVAAALHERLGGFAALAGYPRGDLTSQEYSQLRDVPILLVCMEKDTSVGCSGQAAAVERLRGAGVTRVETHIIKGLGHDCNLDYVAPVLSRWIEGLAGQ